MSQQKESRRYFSFLIILSSSSSFYVVESLAHLLHLEAVLHPWDNGEGFFSIDADRNGCVLRRPMDHLERFRIPVRLDEVDSDFPLAPFNRFPLYFYFRGGALRL